MTDRPLDPDALRYARYWEPVLAPSAQRVLEGLAEAPGSLLDVGAGTGSLTLEAATRWPQTRLIAVDASSAMLAVARARADERGIDPDRFRWIPADARDLPLNDGSVDAAVSSFVLQRIDDRPSLLAEVRRVLRPGSTFGFVTWLADELVVAADEAYHETLAELGHASEEAGLRTPPSTVYISLAEAEAELHAAGFAAVEVRHEELRATWTPASYLQLKEHFEDHERFDALDARARDRLRSSLLARWAELPPSAFEVRSPLVAGVARTPAT